jgi:hypothetical protein
MVDGYLELASVRSSRAQEAAFDGKSPEQVQAARFDW